MAKFINILAASVGGGLVLGASIRLGEAIGHKLVTPAAPEPDGTDGGIDIDRGRGWSPAQEKFTGRLSRLEQGARKDRPHDRTPATHAPSESEWRTALAGVVARVDRQQGDVEAIRHLVSKAARAVDSVDELASNLRNDIQQQVSQDLDRRLAAVEESLRTSMEAAHRETVDAMVNSVEKRVAPRIARIENEIAGQSAAVSELRDCALQSERSIQRLLGVLERVISPGHQNAAGQTGSEQGLGREQTTAGSSKAEEPRLAVVTGRGQDEAETGDSSGRRPSSFRRL